MLEDQAGKVDWYRQQIGRATHARFHAVGQQRLALVATEQGVIAGLDLRTGATTWRQVLPAGESVAVLTQHGKALLSVSVAAAGAYVRMWTAAGSLVWDAHLPATGPAAAAPAPDVVFTGSSVVVSWQSRVTSLQGSSGEPMWEYKHDDAQLVALVLPVAQPASGSTVYAYGIADDQLVAVTLTNGKRAGSAATLYVRGVAPSAQVAVTLDKKHLAVLDTTGRTLLMHAVGSAKAYSYPVPELPAGVAASLSAASLPGMLLVSHAEGSLLLAVEPSGAPSLSRAVAGAPGSHAFAHTTSREGKAVVALAALGAGGAGPLALEALQIEADGARSEWAAQEPLPYDFAEHGPLADGWLNSYARKDGSLGHRLLLSSTDHALQLLQSAKDGAAGAAGWAREECLATVRAAEGIPLPRLAAESTEGTPRPQFAFALPAIVGGFAAKWAALSAALAGPRAAGAGPPPPHGDAYGFRQTVVATTGAGKLAGLHSSDGSLLWTARVPPPEGPAAAAPPALPFLFVCKGGVHAEVVAVAQGDGAWAVHAYAPSSGRRLAASIRGAGTVLHAAKLGFVVGEHETPPVMVVDDQLNVHLHPDTAEARALLRARLGDVFFYLHRKAEGTLGGYAVALKDRAAPAGREAFVASSRWQLVLPASEDGAPAAVTMSSFSHDAAVHSPVRSLGDRTILHKYINRNLLAVGLELDGAGEFAEPTLQLLLVDTVSGKVVHSASHPGAKGPLRLLLGENWLVYHFWSPKALSYQFAVTELFTNSTAADDPLSLVLNGALDYSQRANGFDGFASHAPTALSQGYAFGASVSALGVSITQQGITPKHVLVATNAGQLVLLDKRFLDPRRPLLANPAKMSAADREEGLVPYSPSLGGIAPLSVASHRHTLARPRAIHTFATTLESTSLAVVVGLDLFLTRVAPAREFDRLNEDFNYVALVGAIVFLTAATVGTGWYSDRRDLMKSWN